MEVRPDNGADRRGLLRFDLSDIPSNATITSAKLYLYELDNKPDQVTYVYRVTTAWTETGVTWATPWIQPGGDFYSETAYALYIPNQKNCSVALDVSGLVQNWVSGRHPNYGLMLYSTGPNHIISYTTKEDAKNPERAPRLEITYTIDAASQPSFLETLLNFFNTLFSFLSGKQA